MQQFRHNEECMGTVFQFFGRAQVETTNQISEALRILHQADEMFSLYKPTSELSRLARGETSVAELPEVVSFVWDECEKWQERTDGWFSSMTKENTFDPSGFVKAWATVQAANKLLELGVRDFAINAGGDIYLSPEIQSGLPKRVGVANAQSIAKTLQPVTIVDLNETEFLAVATSGVAERGENIWNPRTYHYADELKQVTVIAKDLITADVLATAIFAAGNQAEKLITKFSNEIEVLLIDSSGDVFTTPGFSSLVTPV